MTVGLADLVAVDVDVGRLHLLEALDGLPDHDCRARQRRPLALLGSDTKRLWVAGGSFQVAEM